MQLKLVHFVTAACAATLFGSAFAVEPVVGTTLSASVLGPVTVIAIPDLGVPDPGPGQAHAKLVQVKEAKPGMPATLTLKVLNKEATFDVSENVAETTGLVKGETLSTLQDRHGTWVTNPKGALVAYLVDDRVK